MRGGSEADLDNDGTLIVRSFFGLTYKTIERKTRLISKGTYMKV